MFAPRIDGCVGHADAVITDDDDPVRPVAADGDGQEAFPSAFKAVDDGIGDEFVQDQSQGCRRIRRRGQGVAGKLRLHVAILADQAVRQEAQQFLGDVRNVDVLFIVMGQRLVDQGNAEDPVQALVEDIPRFVARRAPHLHAQEAGNGLQVILDAVVDFLDDRRLDHEFFFLAMQFRPLSQDGNDPAHFAALQNRDDPAGNDSIA